MHAVVCEPKLESQLRDSLNDGILTIDPAALERFVARLNELRQTSLAEDQEIVFLVESGLRRAIRMAIERSLPDLVVVGYSEVPKDVRIEFKNILTSDEVFPIREADTSRMQTTMTGAA